MLSCIFLEGAVVLVVLSLIGEEGKLRSIVMLDGNVCVFDVKRRLVYVPSELSVFPPCILMVCRRMKR